MAYPAKLRQIGGVDKYVRDGMIVPDMRIPVDFILTLVKGESRIERKCYTRADTVGGAEKLVRQVASAIVSEDGYDFYEVKLG